MQFVRYRHLIACMLVFALTAQTASAQFGPSQALQDQIRRQRELLERQRREMEERMRGGLRIPGQPGAQAPQPKTPASSPVSSSSRTQSAATDRTGLRFTPGPVSYSNGESVLVREKDGKTVTGRHHVTIGETKIVLMPDGRLETFDLAQTRPTDEKFEPLSISKLKAKLLSDPKLRGFKTLQSRHFLYVYNCSDLFIKSTRTIQETMYPAVKKWFGKSGIDIRTPELPLVVIAFATEDEYQNYRRMPDGVVAYYDMVTNNVFLYEKSRLSEHAPEIAVKNAISTIAHEGAHQVLHNIGVQQRLSRWPLWLSEGLAEFFAPTSTVRGARWSGIGASNELRMMEISRDLKSGSQRGTTGFGSGNRIRKITSADNLESLGYSYSWALIHTQAKRHSRELFRCIRECSKLRPLDGSPAVQTKVPTAAEVFETFFGKDYAAVEEEMAKHLSTLKYVDPVQTQTHYVVVAGGRVVMTTSPETVKEMQRFGGARISRYPNRQAAERAMSQLTN